MKAGAVNIELLYNDLHHLRKFELIATAHRYCARKFTRHVIHRARALSNKIKK